MPNERRPLQRCCKSERTEYSWSRIRVTRDAATAEWRHTSGVHESDASGAAADRAVDLEPFHPYGHWSRAVALLALDRTPDAVPAMTDALSRAGGIGHLHLAAGSVLLYLSMQQPDLRPLAIDVLREAGRIHPWHHSAAVKLATDLGIPESEQAGLSPRR